MSTIAVTSLTETALRAAIDGATNGDVIDLVGFGAIALSQPLEIDKNITIEGNLSPSGAPNVTIEAAGLGASRGSFPQTSAALITIGQGAQVELANLIISGASGPDAAPDGADGEGGFDGAEGSDGSGADGGVGGAGGSGIGAAVNGASGIGALANFGMLTLANDFVHGFATGGDGGAGGRGGDGGTGGDGGSGTSDGAAAGAGGTGGTGGLGGSGGDGSNGGNAAGAIVNEGTLHLVDTIIADSGAFGGRGGGGGSAGFGGSGGQGGEGGSIRNFAASGAGTGGDGGNGNNGGDGGDGGTGGAAVGALSNLGVINVSGAVLLYFNTATGGAAGSGGVLGGIGGAGDSGVGGFNGNDNGPSGEPGQPGGFPGHNGTGGAQGAATPNLLEAGSLNGTLTVEDGLAGVGNFSTLVGAAYYEFAQTQPQALAVEVDPSTNSSVTFTYLVNMVGDVAHGGSVQWAVAGGVNSPSATDFESGGALPSGVLTFANTATVINGFGSAQQSFSFTLDVGTSTAGENFTIVLSNPGGDGTSTSPAGTLGLESSIVQDLISAGGPIEGTPGADPLMGTPGNDLIEGLAGNDTITGEGGNDTIDGGDGTDTAVYLGPRSEYLVHSASIGGTLVTTVTDQGASGDGIDTLRNIESLQFSDGTFALAGIDLNRMSNFDGHAYDDVMLQVAGTGQLVFANMEAGAFAGNFGTLTSPLPGVNAVGHADMNGDGIADVIVQVASTDMVLIAEQDGSGSGAPNWVAATSALKGGSADFKAVGVGDITGDGTPDIILQNEGATGDGSILAVTSGGSGTLNIVSVSGPLRVDGVVDFRVVGVGDINGDGFADIVLQNQLNGGQVLVDDFHDHLNFTLANVTGPFQVVGVGDVNGDGHADVILQQASGGDVIYLDPTGGANDFKLVVSGIGGFLAKGVADVNNDGFAEVLLENPATGEVDYRHVGASDTDGFFGAVIGPNGGALHLV